MNIKSLFKVDILIILTSCARLIGPFFLKHLITPHTLLEKLLEDFEKVCRKTTHLKSDLSNSFFQ